VTGVKTADAAEIAMQLPRLRAASKLPIGVGFGIKDAESARAIAKFSDAVIIGTRIVQEIESAGAEHAVARVKALLVPIRKALDS
jgi:tryptophan synthase alpha chain